jgi:hypothetical protein
MSHLQNNLLAPPGAKRAANGDNNARGDRERPASERAAACTLARYLRSDGALRELLVRPGASGSRLLLDRDALTRGDARLVAHLAPDEPRQNAQIICALYLADPSRGRCRALTAGDLRTLPAELICEQAPALPARALARGLRDEQGNRFRIALLLGRGGDELRWVQSPPSAHAEGARAPVRPVALRGVIGFLERYEPALAHTRAALAGARRHGAPTAERLARELTRLEHSPYVLNRALREAVLCAIDQERLTLGEIALRCGRIKRDLRGAPGGETSWLARRIGLAPERAGGRRSPWIHSDLLALIARRGLGVDPREVETG